MSDFQIWVKDFVKAGFTRARSGLHLQPAVRITLEAGEAATQGLIDEGFARLEALKVKESNPK